MEAKHNLYEIGDKNNEITRLLADQQHTFNNIYKKNEDNYNEVNIASGKISNLERSRICKVILLHLIAILLFFAIMLVLIFKLYFR